MAVRAPKAVQPLIDFAVHVVVGAIAFAVVFLVAVALAAFIHFLEDIARAPGWLVTSAAWVEMALFALDIFVFSLFLISETVKLVRGLWLEFQRHEAR